jgi:hypothetical protein
VAEAGELLLCKCEFKPQAHQIKIKLRFGSFQSNFLGYLLFYTLDSMMGRD